MFRSVTEIALPILYALTILGAGPVGTSTALAEEISPVAKGPATKAPVQESSAELPVVFKDGFERDLKAWKTTDDSVWKIIEIDRKGEKTKALRVTGKSKYAPPVRSPHSIAWLKDKVVGDFVLTVKAENTNYKAGGHRDLCLFWGKQDASHFYYVHFGAKADPHSCQIFIVNGEPRTKITVDEVDGTPWGEGREWHTLRVERNVKQGTIKVYFDDMKKPHMTAKDSTFSWGQVGIGTFDDNGNFDEFELRGTVVKPTKRVGKAS